METICKRCGARIDKSNAQERFCVITRTGVERETYKERFYLCDGCTRKMDVFLVDYDGKYE